MEGMQKYSSASGNERDRGWRKDKSDEHVCEVISEKVERREKALDKVRKAAADIDSTR